MKLLTWQVVRVRVVLVDLLRELGPTSPEKRRCVPRHERGHRGAPGTRPHNCHGCFPAHLSSRSAYDLLLYMEKYGERSAREIQRPLKRGGRFSTNAATPSA